MFIFSKACRLAMWPTPPLIQLEEEGDDDKDLSYHLPCEYFLKFESKVDPVHAMTTYWGVGVWHPFFLKLNHR